VRSAEPVPPGLRRLGVRVRRLTREVSECVSEFTLLIDGIPSGRISSRLGLHNFVSWTGLDIGRDRGSPVSDYASPFAFTGKLVKVTVTMDDDQTLHADGVGSAQMAHD
jgi:arylsulfatase